MLAFPPYAPDVADIEANSTATALNVVPQSDGWGPFPAAVAYSGALPSACRGYFSAIKNDGSVAVFAGTSTRLFLLNNTNFTWTPVSKVTALTSISNGSPAVFTLNAHGLANGDTLVLSTSGTLPTGLTVGTIYFVINVAANTFNVSLTSGGAAVNTSGAGSGTHSMTYLYTALPASDQWQFVQFNNFVIAVNIGVTPQVIDLTTALAFADLGGSPPQARYIATVNRFVVLSGLGSSTPYRIQWSGLNAVTTWTSGVNQSDFQDLPDGGIVRSVSGGEYGLITQDASLRRMTYAPGAPYVFQIERISEQKGILAPLSLVRAGDRVFFIASDGAKMILPGQYPQPIGRERVDRTLLDDIDAGNLQLCIGAADPNVSRVYWAYKSRNGQAGLFDKLIGYDWALDRWFLLSLTGEFLASMSKPGLTLEGLDSISASLDALTTSLDDFSTATLAQLSAVDSTHKIVLFSGSNTEATIVSAEQSVEGERLFIRGIRPFTDAPTVFGSISARETQQATATFSTEASLNTQGFIPQRVSTRFARAKIRIPAATVWAFAKGVEADFTSDGKR